MNWVIWIVSLWITAIDVIATIVIVIMFREFLIRDYRQMEEDVLTFWLLMLTIWFIVSTTWRIIT